jgi:hypothetical protein
VYLLAAQCAVPQQGFGQLGDALLRPCAAHEAFGGDPTTR